MGFHQEKNAGTEQHTSRVVQEMKSRGHTVQLISATRAPGRLHGEVLSDEPNCHRIVNNIPARPLTQHECDGHIRDKINRQVEKFNPDIVHIQHIQYLSADISFECPTAFTFHDSWAWCPAGGLELRWPTQENCHDPAPEDCATCSALWHPQLSPKAHTLMNFAQKPQPNHSFRVASSGVAKTSCEMESQYFDRKRLASPAHTCSRNEKQKASCAHRSLPT